MSHELNILLVESITMNTRKKLVSIILLMASITTVIISTTGLVTPAENGYVHAWPSGGNVDDKGQIENLDAGVSYYDYIDHSIENPYEDGWD
jgi:hypothetical protein